MENINQSLTESIASIFLLPDVLTSIMSEVLTYKNVYEDQLDIHVSLPCLC